MSPPSWSGKNGFPVEKPYIPVIPQAACGLALLPGSSMSLALEDRRYTAFKSVPDRFVAHPT
ncbi:hypothetical protein C5T93_05530 [Raoultella ornithinolytica]|nr:hypothetical protein C5T93_05530 [Raoultella ornithinolytica]